jgi:hypothetical protein
VRVVEGGSEGGLGGKEEGGRYGEMGVVMEVRGGSGNL